MIKRVLTLIVATTAGSDDMKAWERGQKALKGRLKAIPTSSGDVALDLSDTKLPIYAQTIRSLVKTEKVAQINSAKIEAEKEDRPIRDGEIVTACEAVCPAKAITFGNINDPASRVSQLKADKLSYGLLGELNTRPRTTYLGALRNPNPEIKA